MMDIPAYAYNIKDGASFTYKHVNEPPTVYNLYWNQESPRWWTVYQNGTFICDDYPLSSLHFSMQRGSLIDGNTLEELEAEVMASEIVDEDIDMTSLI